MKATFFTATVLSTLAALSAAAPSNQVESRQAALPPVTVTLRNDLNGRNGAATVIPDGVPRGIQGLYANTPATQNGAVLASSIELTNFPQGVACVVQAAAGGSLATVNSQRTFADLDGDVNVARPVNLNGANLICRI